MGEKMPSREYHDYSGVIHIHSIHSDGAKTVPEIVQAAVEAGCSYLILTDHDTLAACPREGLYGRTLLLVGEEITLDNEAGHYLGMRLKSEVAPCDSPQNTINEVKKQGGLGFIAHPYAKNELSKFNLTPVTWKEWNITGITGMEIWNYSHDWVENFTWYNFLIGWLYPDTFIEGPLPEAAAKYDELSQQGHISAIGSVDAHGLFYPYHRMFQTLRTHLLLEEPLAFRELSFKRDRALIYRALERGRCYLGFDHLGESSGFIFSIENENEREQGIMGDIINLSSGAHSPGSRLRLEVKSPQPGLIRILRNGRLIASGKDTAVLIKDISETGVYRAEVYLESYKGLNKCRRPWIYSNPIYVE